MPLRRNRLTSSLSEDVSPLVPSILTEEQEVDVRLEVLKAAAYLARKRSRIGTLERGEGPDEPVVSNPEDQLPSSKRSRGEVWSKLQLPVLKYKGQTWGELNTFLYKLEECFELHRDKLRSDIQKVVYSLHF